ncbi:MAG TPA: SGNH/GDSL hydrolase family protein [Bryobacteraceae bacterium]|nr:SGNH/GDSL hydrolase family protein [Bryobacteraceae bacterium]
MPAHASMDVIYSGPMKLLAALLTAGCCLWAQSGDAAKAAQLEKKLHDWAGLTVFGSDDSEIRPPAPGENRVVFLGDSITADWGQGAAKFFPGRPYYNRGIEEQTTPQMLVRFRQDVIELQPKVVVIEGGMNDIAGVMGPGTEGTIAENLLSMIDLAKAHGIHVVIASLTPVCDCDFNQSGRRPPGRIAAINGTLRGIAKQTGSVYLDFYSALVNPAKRQMKKELTSDGLIPNDAGYALMAPLAEKAIADALSMR